MDVATDPTMDLPRHRCEAQWGHLGLFTASFRRMGADRQR